MSFKIHSKFTQRSRKATRRQVQTRTFNIHLGQSIYSSNIWRVPSVYEHKNTLSKIYTETKYKFDWNGNFTAKTTGKEILNFYLGHDEQIQSRVNWANRARKEDTTNNGNNRKCGWHGNQKYFRGFLNFQRFFKVSSVFLH